LRGGPKNRRGDDKEVEMKSKGDVLLLGIAEGLLKKSHLDEMIGC
jgi:hypothetical protein